MIAVEAVGNCSCGQKRTACPFDAGAVAICLDDLTEHFKGKTIDWPLVSRPVSLRLQELHKRVGVRYFYVGDDSGVSCTKSSSEFGK